MIDFTPWIRGYTLPKTPPAPSWKVLFFPHAGGSADSCRPLAVRLADTAHVACVQYPGRAQRHQDPPFSDVHAVADEVADALASWHGGGPVLLFGHSLGALIAYEVARRTHDQDRIVLVASGHPAPSHLGPRLLTGAQSSRADDPDERAAGLVRSLGGDDAGLLDHPLTRRMFLPLIRSDLEAHDRYLPRSGRALRCPVIALMGDSDPLTDRAGVEAWRGHTSSTFRLHTLPGGHFFTGRHPEEVTDILRRTMSVGLGVERVGGLS
ncbi:alpha/beta fold hydrolase [Streptomyces sp. NPDC029216]|uniref:thioesterase II family protein n=1 Tax=Streptomyces sp. NPDC029216 TaxID=3154701 RepID=UPI00340A8607